MLKIIQRACHVSCGRTSLRFSPIKSPRILWKQCRKMSESVIVRTTLGELRGKRALSKAGVTYNSFQGVPYAKPPVGPLRFLPPRPPEPWSGVRDALTEGNVCVQKDPFLMALVGDEDCLFLNVYAPQVVLGGAPRAVMVFLHGGGFNSGSGNTDFYGPDFLVANDVVLVTINYRLSVLGFLRLEEAGVSGNAGLKDQVAAMRWVQQNIAAFGGDPSNVTLFGESAGAACVEYHMLSPMSQGLFHRAICQSGSALCWWAYNTPSTATYRAFNLGRLLGCDTDRQDKLLEFLREQDARELFKVISKTSSKETRTRGGLFPFGPTFERSSDGAFLTEPPLTRLTSGKVDLVPYMAGANSHEGILMLREILAKPSKWQTLDQEFEKMMIPLDMNVKLRTELAREVAEKVRSFYFKEQPIAHETRLNYAEMITDYWFSYGVDKSVKLHAAHSSAPVWYFEFSFDGAFSLFKRIMGFDDLPGACHADDLGYLFTNNFLDYDSPPDSPEMVTLQRMVKMWTDFAKTGRPTEVASDWPTYSSEQPAYLDIGTELTVSRDRSKQRMDFWDQMYQRTGKVQYSEPSKL